MHWTKLAVIPFCFLSIVVPAFFASHFGFTVNGEVSHSFWRWIGNSFTFSIDGLPDWVSLYFWVDTLLLIAVGYLLVRGGD